MAGTVYFVGADTQRCLSVSESYTALGWETPVAGPADFDLVDRLVNDAPVAAIFCLEPEHAETTFELTGRLMSDERFQRPLMVYLDGDAELNARIKEICPFGVFVSGGELGWVLKHLIPKE